MDRVSGFLGIGILVVKYDKVTADYEKFNNRDKTGTVQQQTAGYGKALLTRGWFCQTEVSLGQGWLESWILRVLFSWTDYFLKVKGLFLKNCCVYSMVML